MNCAPSTTPPAQRRRHCCYGPVGPNLRGPNVGSGWEPLTLGPNHTFLLIRFSSQESSLILEESASFNNLTCFPLRLYACLCFAFSFPVFISSLGASLLSPPSQALDQNPRDPHEATPRTALRASPASTSPWTHTLTHVSTLTTSLTTTHSYFTTHTRTHTHSHACARHTHSRTHRLCLTAYNHVFSLISSLTYTVLDF